MPETQGETFLQRRLREKAEREAAERPVVTRTEGSSAIATAEDPRAQRWIEQKVTAQLNEVRSAQEGTRNDTLNRVAYSLGRRVPAYLDEQHITDELIRAALDSGLDPREARLTVASGLAKGMTEPLEVSLSDEPGEDLRRLVAGPVSVTAPRTAPLLVDAETGEVLDADEPVIEAPSSWVPLDLASYLDGTHVPETPTLLLRSDSAATIYPGRVHWLSGEPEALKSWLAMLAVAQVLHRGGRAVYIDLEDGPSGVTGRLLAMGVPAERLGPAHFAYLAPHEPLRFATREALAPVVEGTDLLVIDACTESLALQQLSPKDDVDIASWLALLPRWATRLGPAVLVLDHVVKDTESRGRWATGSQHKLAGLDGVAFTLEAVTPGGKGMRGRSRLYVSKDRHGEVRPHTVPVAGNKQWLGDLIVDSTGAFADVVLHPPVEQTEEFRPTVLMERVAQTMAKLARPVSTNEIEDRVKGRRGDIRKALACLVDDGFVQVHKGARGVNLHSLAKPYPPEEKEWS